MSPMVALQREHLRATAGGSHARTCTSLPLVVGLDRYHGGCTSERRRKASRTPRPNGSSGGGPRTISLVSRVGDDES